MADHKVQGAVVAPGAAYMETALAAAREVLGEGVHELENVTFAQQLFLSEGRPHSVELVLEAEASGRSSFQFFQAPADGDPKAAWTLHVSGAVRRVWDDAAPRAWCANLGEARAHCTEERDRAACYRILGERGLDYGPAFQVIDYVWQRPAEAVTRLRLAKTAESESPKYLIHPALLDGCLQTVAGAIPEDFIRAGSGDTYLPAGLKRLRVHARPEGELWAHARLTTDFEKEGLDLLEGDLQSRDAAGSVFFEMEGLSFRRLAKSQTRDAEEALPDWLYEVRWLEREPTPPTATAPTGWLLFADGAGLDSLMVIELKNLLESDTGVVLPIARFLEGASLVQLAALVLEGLGSEDKETRRRKDPPYPLTSPRNRPSSHCRRPRAPSGSSTN